MRIFLDTAALDEASKYMYEASPDKFKNEAAARKYLAEVCAEQFQDEPANSLPPPFHPWRGLVALASPFIPPGERENSGMLVTMFIAMALNKARGIEEVPRQTSPVPANMRLILGDGES